MTTFQVMGNPKKIGEQLVLRIPKEISQTFPSRSMVMVDGQINGKKIQVPLEPDGEGSHFLLLEPNMLKDLATEIVFDFSLASDWHNPPLPADLTKQLKANELMDIWDSLTPKARWEWVRWIRSTKVEATKQKRIGVAISKLSKGDRRPCCFNTATCTIPQLAKSGVLKVSDLD